MSERESKKSKYGDRDRTPDRNVDNPGDDGGDDDTSNSVSPTEYPSGDANIVDDYSFLTDEDVKNKKTEDRCSV